MNFRQILNWSFQDNIPFWKILAENTQFEFPTAKFNLLILSIPNNFFPSFSLQWQDGDVKIQDSEDREQLLPRIKLSGNSPLTWFLLTWFPQNLVSTNVVSANIVYANMVFVNVVPRTWFSLTWFNNVVSSIMVYTNVVSTNMVSTNVVFTNLVFTSNMVSANTFFVLFAD